MSVDYRPPEGYPSPLIYYVTWAVQPPSQENYFDYDLVTHGLKPELSLTPELDRMILFQLTPIPIGLHSCPGKTDSDK